MNGLLKQMANLARTRNGYEQTRYDEWLVLGAS
jgi:hypothetical protein